MKIQAPGGFVTVLSILWLLVGLVLAYDGQFVVATVIMLPALLLWTRSYKAANFFIFCLACTALTSAGKLILLYIEGEVPASVRNMLLMRMLFSAACIPSLWRWSDAHHPDMQKT